MNIIKIFILLIAFSSVAFAQTYEVSNVITDSESVFNEKENAINLEELQNLVINDNTEVEVAYERLFIAQKHIAQARAAYFPYGVGTVSVAYFTGSFTYLILAELLTSLPSKIFEVQKRKHLRTAQRHNVEVVKANIKNQTALIYYSFLKQEALLKLAEIELDLLITRKDTLEVEVELGLATQDDLSSISIGIMRLTDAFLKFKSFYLAEQQALNLLTGRDFSDKVFVLQPVGKFESETLIVSDYKKLQEAALFRSNELKSANAVIRASISNRRSTKWSVISFAGIGFGYVSRVRHSKSQVVEAKLRRELVETNVKNAVMTRLSNLNNTIGIFGEDYKLMSFTKNILQGDIMAFEAGATDTKTVISDALYFLRDLRDVVRTHYDVLIKKHDLKRVVLGSLNIKDNASGDIALNNY